MGLEGAPDEDQTVSDVATRRRDGEPEIWSLGLDTFLQPPKSDPQCKVHHEPAGQHGAAEALHSPESTVIADDQLACNGTSDQDRHGVDTEQNSVPYTDFLDFADLRQTSRQKTEYRTRAEPENHGESDDGATARNGQPDR